MVKIEVRSDEDLEKAIRLFKRKIEKEEIIKEYRRRRYFTKPSTEKRMKDIARKRKLLKKQRKLNKRFLY